MRTKKIRTFPIGDWMIRPCLGRAPSRVWYREHLLAQWIPVQQVGTAPEGLPILREVDREVVGIWLPQVGSEILHL